MSICIQQSVNRQTAPKSSHTKLVQVLGAVMPGSRRSILERPGCTPKDAMPSPAHEWAIMLAQIKKSFGWSYARTIRRQVSCAVAHMTVVFCPILCIRVRNVSPRPQNVKSSTMESKWVNAWHASSTLSANTQQSNNVRLKSCKFFPTDLFASSTAAPVQAAIRGTVQAAALVACGSPRAG